MHLICESALVFLEFIFKSLLILDIIQLLFSDTSHLVLKLNYNLFNLKFFLSTQIAENILANHQSDFASSDFQFVGFDSCLWISLTIKNLKLWSFGVY